MVCTESYLEREIIKIKDFVASDEVRINKGINETRQKLKSLNNEMKSKFGKTGSEKVLKNMLESLSEKVMKIKTDFKRNVSSELEKCAEICRKEKVNIEKKALFIYLFLFNHLLNQQRILQIFFFLYHAGFKVDGPP